MRVKLYLLIIVIISFGSINIYSQNHQSWSYNLNMYEVNTRHFTPSGTFNEFRTHLDRLKQMGVGIIWMMPINPIGVQKRLGTLGSPYSVKNYLEVNPEFGTFADFKALVDSIHAKGMYVIIDWVANHTSWDNILTTTHPEWYIKDNNGNFTAPPGTNWSDVIQLDYSKQALRDYMTNTMSYWVTNAGVDGFRCDAVSFMPGSFWSNAITALKTIRPDILMLAEDDGPLYQSYGFDMTYAWTMYGFGGGVLKRLVNRTTDANGFNSVMNTEYLHYGDFHYRLYFTSNHDENAWYGTVNELFGNAAEQFAVLTGTINSMHLIYNGQEAGLNKRLKFFDKDLVPWQESPYRNIYTTLWNLKKVNKALWNGNKGSFPIRVDNSVNNKVYSFIREKDNDKIFAVFNLSPDYTEAFFTDTTVKGKYVHIFTNDTVSFYSAPSIQLNPWGYKVFRKIGNITGINELNSEITGFELLQNYPNPFNPSTVISYKVAEYTHVTLKVFDLLGREVSTLVNENKNPGIYEVNFNASDLPSGIYFYTINASHYRNMLKMLLVK